MAFTTAGATAALDAIFNNTALQKSARYLKLHTGDPGPDGTDNPAADTTRKAITGAAASAGVFTSTNDLAWTPYGANETVTHGSVWDAATAGNCLLTGELESPQGLVIGNHCTSPAGQAIFTG